MDDVPGVHPRHEQFVLQASTMAPATVDGLAKAAVSIGRTIHRGDTEGAFDHLDLLLGRMGKFLNYVVLAEQLLFERDPATGGAMLAFKRGLFHALDDVELAMAQRDVTGLGVELARSLATAVLEYHHIAAAVEHALLERGTTQVFASAA